MNSEYIKKYQYVSKVVHENTMGTPSNGFLDGSGGVINMVRFMRFTCTFSGHQQHAYIPASSAHIAASYDIPTRNMGTDVYRMGSIELWGNGERLKQKGLSRKNINNYLHNTYTREIFVGDAILSLPEPHLDMQLPVKLSVRALIGMGESHVADSIRAPRKFSIPIEVEGATRDSHF